MRFLRLPRPTTVVNGTRIALIPSQISRPLLPYFTNLTSSINMTDSTIAAAAAAAKSRAASRLPAIITIIALTTLLSIVFICLLAGMMGPCGGTENGNGNGNMTVMDLEDLEAGMRHRERAIDSEREREAGRLEREEGLDEEGNAPPCYEVVAVPPPCYSSPILGSPPIYVARFYRERNQGGDLTR